MCLFCILFKYLLFTHNNFHSNIVIWNVYCLKLVQLYKQKLKILNKDFVLVLNLWNSQWVNLDRCGNYVSSYWLSLFVIVVIESVCNTRFAYMYLLQTNRGKTCPACDLAKTKTWITWLKYTVLLVCTCVGSVITIAHVLTDNAKLFNTCQTRDWLTYTCILFKNRRKGVTPHQNLSDMIESLIKFCFVCTDFWNNKISDFLRQ